MPEQDVSNSSTTAPNAAAIGREVRAARVSAGLSMRELASRIETSQPFVSNIENGRIFPSLRTLAVIAEVLSVTPDRLLPAHEHLERRDALTGMRKRGPGAPASRRLVGSEATMLQAFRVELAAGETEPRPFVHDGEDIVFVLRGQVEVLREGQGGAVTGEGETVHIQGVVPHRLKGGAEGAEVLIISRDGSQHAETESSS